MVLVLINSRAMRRRRVSAGVLCGAYVLSAAGLILPVASAQFTDSTASVAPVASAGAAASAEPVMQLSCRERHLDQFASTYDDLAAALASVSDREEADFVASRVALDFILLHRLDRRLKDEQGEQIRDCMIARFVNRCDQSRQAVCVAMERLKLEDCFGSSALEAALELSHLQDGRLSLARARELGRRLHLNSAESELRLLRRVNDRDSAQTIAPLLHCVRSCGRSVDEYLTEYAGAAAESCAADEVAERLEAVQEEMGRVLQELRQRGYYGCRELEDEFRDL